MASSGLTATARSQHRQRLGAVREHVRRRQPRGGVVVGARVRPRLLTAVRAVVASSGWPPAAARPARRTTPSLGHERDSSASASSYAPSCMKSTATSRTRCGSPARWAPEARGRRRRASPSSWRSVPLVGSTASQWARRARRLADVGPSGGGGSPRARPRGPCRATRPWPRAAARAPRPSVRLPASSRASCEQRRRPRRAGARGQSRSAVRAFAASPSATSATPSAYAISGSCVARASTAVSRVDRPLRSASARRPAGRRPSPARSCAGKRRRPSSYVA